METERWEVGIPATTALHQVERFRVEGKAGRYYTLMLSSVGKNFNI